MTQHMPVAIVTGGTRGIGYGIAQKLLEVNFNVVICARKSERPAETIFPNQNGHSHYVKCDISMESDRQHLVDYTQESFGRVDVLVNNAGIAPKERLDILETSQESYDRVMNTNLRGPFFLSQLVANEMIKLQKSADKPVNYTPMIINISSISAFTSSPSRSEYCLSKAGISMMTKLYADRLAAEGIPVYEIQPGIIKTPMTSSVEEKYTKLIDGGLLPIKRWGLPEDIGKAVAMVVMGGLPYSTGQVLNIDGGFHLHRL
jgi:3-oxoacyl-[acyl-carrier protein] reductase